MRTIATMLLLFLTALLTSGCGGKEPTTKYITKKPEDPKLEQPKIKNCAVEKNVTKKTICKMQNYMEYKGAYLARDKAIEGMTE